MYEKLEGGSSVNIQGIICNLPPIGYVFNIITKKLEYRGVFERSPKKELQYWEKQPLPSWYKETVKKWDDYDKKKKDEDPDFYDARLEEFKADQWDKRLNGMWFMNNGVPVYLTGLHWLYLQHWSIDIGSPKFRIPDLEKSYFLQYCIEDPLSMGMVEITKRRFGKSFFAGIFLLEYITRTKMTQAGIQSKTGPDAKKFFAKTVVNPFRRLPKFFRPEYDMSLGVNPKTEMRFQKTNVRGKKAEENVDKDELGSVVDWGSADKVHYDGQKLHRYVADECGKTSEANVYDRHEVIRYCLLDDEGTIIGKALYTTTVEKLESDKDGVQAAFKLLWDESDQNVKGEDGKTVSGLYRFFMSAKRTRHFDDYGYPDVDATLKEILLDRETVKKNPRALAARMRKEPITINEAFLADSDECIFNSINIDRREQELAEKPVYKRNLLFYRDVDGVVKPRDFKGDEDTLHWEITKLPPPGQENKFVYENGQRKPGRIDIGAMSVDGYSNSQGGKKWGSKACCWIGLRPKLDDPSGTRKPIGRLYGRPPIKEIFTEQVLLAAEYFGFEVYWEHVADDYFGYFRDRGRLLYLGIYPLSMIPPEDRATAERHRGVPTTQYSINRQNDMGLSYFEDHIDLIDWVEILKDARKYDPNDRTKSDQTVSLLILIVVLHEPVIKPKPRKAPLVNIYSN
jgi:hypothetical protein